MKPVGAISSDIDTLQSIYRGRGLRRPRYSYAELRMGLETFSRFLEPYRIKATLFMVGADFLVPENHDAIRAVAAAGHEIANHTHTHAQGFRLLPPEQQERELAQMEDACVAVTGKRPAGFRSPGWNMGDSAVEILERRGYLYDSSVHPMFATPALKALHWLSTADCDALDRTTLGQWSYMFAPLRPYRCDGRTLTRRGNGLVELPLSVVPIVRAPFWATFLQATGFGFFKTCYRLVTAMGLPVHYMFHLHDFVDYSHPDLADQVPAAADRVYVPGALRTPLAPRLDLFRRALDVIAADYQLSTCEQWARSV